MYEGLTFSYLDVHEHAVERYSDCMEDSPFSYLDVVHEYAVSQPHFGVHLAVSAHHTVLDGRLLRNARALPYNTQVVHLCGPDVA